MGLIKNQPLKVVVVGGGVGALELALALQKFAEERVHTTLIAPETEFHYRPASVAVPFQRGEVLRFPLSEIAADAGADLVADTVVSVDPGSHSVLTAGGDRLEYDALVVAMGARRVPVLDGAITFRGEEDIPAVQSLLAEMRDGRVHSVVFALPRGATWALPLYELALMTAAFVAQHDLPGVALSLVTPEDRPLAMFGGEASRQVGELLAGRGIDVHTQTYPVGVYGPVVMLVPAATLPADRVVCMPSARGIELVGLPQDYEGFLPTDLHGRVHGVDDVFAVGDITNHPIKQGGIAAQQAEVVAKLLARRSGAPVQEPEPHRPVLRGLLITAEHPRYLAARPAGGEGPDATVDTEPLRWPGGKIAARHLGAYLMRTGHRARG